MKKIKTYGEAVGKGKCIECDEITDIKYAVYADGVIAPYGMIRCKNGCVAYMSISIPNILYVEESKGVWCGEAKDG